MVACPVGNCHHVRGNERGRARVKRARKILDDVGLGGERLDMFFMSGSQAQAFAIAAKTMTDRIRALGPSPLKANGKGTKEEEFEDDENGFRGRRKS